MRLRLFKIVFLTIIGLILTHPLYLSMFGMWDFPNFENRQMADFPLPEGLKDILWISQKLDTYLTDHLPLRNRLIFRLYWFRREVLNDRVFPSVVIGKDDWLYYTGDHNLSIYQQVLTLSPKELSAIQENLESAQAWLAERDIQMVVVIAPDKDTIYPEYLPDHVPVMGEISQYDQLLYHMKRNSNVRILDLRPVLLERKKSYQSYYKYDTHWNLTGCQAAYEAIMKEVATKFPNLHSYPLQDFTMTTKEVPGDLMQFIGQVGKLETDPFYLIPKAPAQAHVQAGDINNRIEMTVDNPALPRLVILRDSFGTCLIPYLAEHFSYSLFRWETFPTVSILDRELIEQIKPDVVIIELAERYIGPRLVPQSGP